MGRERGVAALAVHGDAERALALVSDHHAHFGRLADKAGRRFHLGAFEARDHAAHADASNLLVVREREVDRPREPRCEHIRHGREAAGVEPLHVGRAAAVEPAVALGQPERVVRP